MNFPKKFHSISDFLKFSKNCCIFLHSSEEKNFHFDLKQHINYDNSMLLKSKKVSH